MGSFVPFDRGSFRRLGSIDTMSRSNPTTNPPVHPPTSNTSSSLAYLQPEEGESSEMGRRRSLGIALGYERGPDQPVSAQTSRSELLSRRSSEAE